MVKKIKENKYSTPEGCMSVIISALYNFAVNSF